MKSYIFSLIFILMIAGCGGGDNGSVNEEILNRPPVAELANVKNLRASLTISDYTLSDEISLPHKDGLEITLSKDGNFKLFDENKLVVATGKTNVGDNVHYYSVTLRFSDNLPDDLFQESISKELVSKEYVGYSNYDRYIPNFKMEIHEKP